MTNDRNPRDRMMDELVPLSIDGLRNILTDPSAKNADKISAIKVTLLHTLGAGAAGVVKNPEDMTRQELDDRILELRARQVYLAQGAKLVEHMPSALPDIFE
ncbi:hypothetical protein [Paracoccus cavernae]|uniref:hypothetical protein n=1 Tax=Paracoccus cavernae TaxID=1571207 RepID=UPI0035F2F672